MNMVLSRHMLFSDCDVFQENREHSVKHVSRVGRFFLSIQPALTSNCVSSLDHRDNDLQKQAWIIRTYPLRQRARTATFKPLLNFLFFFSSSRFLSHQTSFHLQEAAAIFLMVHYLPSPKHKIQL